MKDKKDYLRHSPAGDSPWFPGIYDIRKVWHPSWFQGNRQRKNYFEGWYFKIISRNGNHSWAFIPGISLAKGDQHSFVQAIDGKTGKTWYFRYPLDAFNYAPDRFAVRVGNNEFSRHQMKLQLIQDDANIHGEVSMSGHQLFRAGFQKPGIMGWYRYVPFMECYHGVVSLHHDLLGTITVDNKNICFDRGKGYIEKDWGKSMPEAWVWMQSNNFDESPTSFMLSIASIPWIGKSFTGFLGYFLHNNTRYDFATYTGAKIDKLIISKNTLQAGIRSNTFRLHIETGQQSAGLLKAPLSGKMDRVIHESIDAEIKIILTDINDKVLYEGTGKNAGLEVVGDTTVLGF